MAVTRFNRLGLLGGCAVIALGWGAGAQAGLLDALKPKKSDPVTGVTGTLTTGTAITTTTTLASLNSAIPLTTSLTPLLGKVVVTTTALPGTLTATTKATTSILGNTLANPASLLSDSPVFSPPQSTELEPKWGKIRSFWGKIRSFDGEEVTPFWGKIRSFWGDEGPFEGDTAAFWGSLQTYNDGTSPSSANRAAPEWGKIRSFWGDLGAQWGKIRSFWDIAAAPGDYDSLASQLRGVVDRSALFWGDAVKAGTGKDFQAGFAAPLLAAYAIDLGDPATLARLDANEREHFFLQWYDGLMQYSGADNPDHWMRQVAWSPKLTQTSGEGAQTVIGLLDFTVDRSEATYIKSFKGVSDVNNGHGAAVASLMVAPHDGKGVMGIAPMARVIAYNPFDATETAGWADIRDGIRDLGAHGASVINMSLGVPGWTLHPEWNNVFADPSIQLTTSTAVFVIAAGNDGISQTTSIAWSNAANFIVVGSVDPTGTISDFSNRPGTACLLTNGKCAAGNELMNHFIVAPGEMMLVSDAHGGVTRYSGTSFAAPLVSGTIALIHDRWPWLAKYPKETIDIVLQTATDLGAPGVDPVYGVGQLNVTGALSPISYDALSWYQMDGKGGTKAMSSATVRSTGRSNLAKWEATGMYFTAFETVGASYRDFLIPLSSKLVDKSALSAGGSQEQFQAYLYNQVTDWMKTGPRLRGGPSFNFAATSAAFGSANGVNMTLSMAPRMWRAGLRDGQPLFQSALRVADKDNRLALTIGEGDGAIELGNSLGFGRTADYDPSRGGVNPLLGMASGGAYSKLDYAFSDRFSVSAGVTGQDTRYDRRLFPLTSRAQLPGGYATGAQSISMRFKAAAGVELTGAVTRLDEQDAILGVQALDPAMIGGGSTSTGLTMGATFDVTPRLTLAASGTYSRTAGNRDSLLSADGVRSTAFQLTVTQAHLLDDKDGLRLSLAQPLYVEGGALSVTNLEVIDRDTGELGWVRQSYRAGTSQRPLVGEFHYDRALLDGRARLALFGQAQLAGKPTGDRQAALVTGARFRFRY